MAGLGWNGGSGQHHDNNRSAPDSLEEQGLLVCGPRGCETLVPILSHAAMMCELSVDMTAPGGGPWPQSMAPHLTRSEFIGPN